VLRTIAGTRDYTAPEVAGIYADDNEATDEYTSAVDIWSSGCLLHTLLTNEPPFRGFTLHMYVKGLMTFPYVLWAQRNLSDSAQNLLKRMLAPLPGDRPTAEDCLNDAWLAVQVLGYPEPVF
jgi:serine/threonine protein kinase